MASALAKKLQLKFYGNKIHPYVTFEAEVQRHLQFQRANSTLLDVGCGREAPVLRKFKEYAKELIGLELVEFRNADPELRLLSGSVGAIPLPDHSVNVVMARSVMEHVTDPLSGFREISRVLKPGGSFVFLTPNFYDYASLVAMLVPNRFHGPIVEATEGRPQEDVFPTVYKCNTKKAVQTLAEQSGLVLADFRYLSQYPNYFLFNGILFALAMAYEKLISKVPLLHFLQGWILVTVKKPG
jgi:SAM-dependent methyltransferase